MDIDFKLAIKDEIFSKKTNYSQYTRTPSNKDSLDGVYMFVSLDLSNSTLFKNRYPDYWWETVKTFYDEVREKFKVDKESQCGFSVWKYVGDEVLLYKRIKNINSMYEDIKLSEQATQELIGIIIEETRTKLVDDMGSFFKICNGCKVDFKNEDCDVYIENSKKIKLEYRAAVKGLLKIKTTIWIADCSIQPRGKFNNIIYMSQKYDDDNVLNGTALDFLGPDIDEGFRLAKMAEPNRVIVSPKLAYIIYYSKDKYNDLDRKKIYDSNFKIVTYEEIKGVWDGRIYPIILFSTDFKKTLSEADYDEVYNYQILGQLHEKKRDLLNAASTAHSISKLSKIFSDLGKDEEVERLLSVVEEQSQEIIEKMRRFNRMEVHVACVLCRDNKILALNHKIRGWEFGGIHIKDQATSWREEIIERYKEKYKVDVSIDKNPIPVAVYNYEPQKRRATAFGVVVLGELLNSEDEIKKLSIPKDYNEIRLVDMQEIQQMQKGSEKTVPDFFDCVKRADRILNVNLNADNSHGIDIGGDKSHELEYA